jgi:hypothetical protein
MRYLSGGLMSASPERPCDDKGGVYKFLLETMRYASDLLDRPADETGRRLAADRFVFLGGGLFT